MAWIPAGRPRRRPAAIASDNGYTNDSITSTVTVNIPPVTGAFIGKSGYAEVIVQYNQPRCFSALWGSGTMSVTARTVARGISSPTSPAILLLDPSMPKALNGTGNGNVTVTGGSIVVDSNNSQAGILTGSGNVSAPNINFYGNYGTSGSGQFLGTVKTNVAPTADPLSGLAVPDPAHPDGAKHLELQDQFQRHLHLAARRLHGGDFDQRAVARDWLPCRPGFITCRAEASRTAARST